GVQTCALPIYSKIHSWVEGGRRMSGNRTYDRNGPGAPARPGKDWSWPLTSYRETGSAARNFWHPASLAPGARAAPGWRLPCSVGRDSERASAGGWDKGHNRWAQGEDRMTLPSRRGTLG